MENKEVKGGLMTPSIAFLKTKGYKFKAAPAKEKKIGNNWLVYTTDAKDGDYLADTAIMRLANSHGFSHKTMAKGGAVEAYLDRLRDSLEEMSDEELAKEIANEWGTSADEILIDITDGNERENYINEIIDKQRRVLKSRGEYEKGGHLYGAGEDLSDQMFGIDPTIAEIPYVDSLIVEPTEYVPTEFSGVFPKYENGGNIGSKRQFRYIGIERIPKGLKLILNEEGKEYLDEIEDRSEAQKFDDLFDDVIGNSEYAFHYDGGSMGFGLTEAPMITDGYYYDDDGKFTDADHEKDSEVFAFMDYQVVSPLDELIKNGEVVFEEVPKYEKGGHFKKCPVGTKIQTLLFDTSEFTKKEAKDWAKHNDFTHDFVDAKENHFRIRQHEPADFNEGSFRTIELTEGVKAVIGCPKRKFEHGGDIDADKEARGKRIDKVEHIARELDKIEESKGGKHIIEKLKKLVKPVTIDDAYSGIELSPADKEFKAYQIKCEKRPLSEVDAKSLNSEINASRTGLFGIYDWETKDGKVKVVLKSSGYGHSRSAIPDYYQIYYNGELVGNTDSYKTVLHYTYDYIHGKEVPTASNKDGRLFFMVHRVRSHELDMEIDTIKAIASACVYGDNPELVHAVEKALGEKFEDGGIVPKEVFTHDEFESERAEFNKSFSKEFGTIYPSDIKAQTYYVSSYFPDNKIWKGTNGLWEITGLRSHASLDKAKDALYMKYRLAIGIAKGYEEGGDINTSKGEFEAWLKQAFKEPNKWHFYSKIVDGKSIKMKFHIGAKEVDVQIFTIDGRDAGLPKNYVGKKETLGMIEKALSEIKFEKGGVVIYGKSMSFDELKKKLEPLDTGWTKFFYNKTNRVGGTPKWVEVVISRLHTDGQISFWDKENQKIYVLTKLQFDGYPDKFLKMPEGVKFEEGGAIPELGFYVTENGDDIKGYISTWNKGLGDYEGLPVVYGVEVNSMGGVNSFIVVGGILSEGVLINASEAFDDWFGREDQALEVAKEIAINQHAFTDEYAKGGGVSKTFSLAPYKALNDKMNVSVYEKSERIEGTYSMAIEKAELMLIENPEFTEIIVSTVGKSVLSGKKVALVTRGGITKLEHGGVVDFSYPQIGAVETYRLIDSPPAEFSKGGEVQDKEKQFLHDVYKQCGLTPDKIIRAKKDDGYFVYYRYADYIDKPVPHDFIPDDDFEESTKFWLTKELINQGRKRTRLTPIGKAELDALFHAEATKLNFDIPSEENPFKLRTHNPALLRKATEDIKKAIASGDIKFKNGVLYDGKRILDRYTSIGAEDSDSVGSIHKLFMTEKFAKGGDLQQTVINEYAQKITALSRLIDILSEVKDIELYGVKYRYTAHQDTRIFLQPISGGSSVTITYSVRVKGATIYSLDIDGVSPKIVELRDDGQIITVENGKETVAELGERKFAKGGGTGKEELEKELHKLQRDLNSPRLSTYLEGDTSEEEVARQKERKIKKARFDEILKLLNDKFAKGGDIHEKHGKTEPMVSIDGEEPITMKSFIDANTAPDVEGISKQEIDNLNSMEVGESVLVGFSKIERVFAKGGAIDKPLMLDKSKYDLRIGLGEDIATMFRDFFIKAHGIAKKEYFDNFVNGLNPSVKKEYLKGWREYKGIADIIVEDGYYINTLLFDGYEELLALNSEIADCEDALEVIDELREDAGKSKNPHEAFLEVNEMDKQVRDKVALLHEKKRKLLRG